MFLSQDLEVGVHVQGSWHWLAITEQQHPSKVEDYMQLNYALSLT